MEKPPAPAPSVESTRLPEENPQAQPAAHSLSVSRPMSDEERAALEEVYRERGCGVECDC